VAASRRPLRDHTAAIFITNAVGLWDGSRKRGGPKKVRSSEAAVFKLPAYDPVGIAVLGFGIVFAVALALVF
jgi:hypothetical protein